MRIILYTRRNVGLIALSHLVALGHDVMVVTDDDKVRWLAERLGSDLIWEEGVEGVECDLILSVHWHKKIPMKLIPNNKGANIHPCLFNYKGTDPITRYIQNKDTMASVESHYMTNKFDEGEVIHQQFFSTPVISTHGEFYNVAFPFYWKAIDETLNKILNK